MYTIRSEFDKIIQFFNTSMRHDIRSANTILFVGGYCSVLWIIILVGGYSMSPIREIKTRSQSRLAKWIPVSINHSPGVRIAKRPFSTASTRRFRYPFDTGMLFLISSTSSFTRLPQLYSYTDPETGNPEFVYNTVREKTMRIYGRVDRQKQCYRLRLGHQRAPVVVVWHNGSPKNDSIVFHHTTFSPQFCGGSINRIQNYCQWGRAWEWRIFSEHDLVHILRKNSLYFLKIF